MVTASSSLHFLVRIPGKTGWEQILMAHFKDMGEYHELEVPHRCQPSFDFGNMISGTGPSQVLQSFGQFGLRPPLLQADLPDHRSDLVFRFHEPMLSQVAAIFAPQPEQAFVVPVMELIRRIA